MTLITTDEMLKDLEEVESLLAECDPIVDKEYFERLKIIKQDILGMLGFGLGVKPNNPPLN